MKLRFEIVDSEHPEWRGARFSTLHRAERELEHAVPPGRFHIVDRDAPPTTPTTSHEFRNITEIRAANRAAGDHWFDPDTLRFFSSVVYRPVYSGRYFVTSECPPAGTRRWSVRVARPDGSIDTVGGFMDHATYGTARHAAERAHLTDTDDPEVTTTR